MALENKKRANNEKSKIYGVYIKSLLTQKVVLSMNEIGKNTKQNLEQKIRSRIEGKCIEQGFIRPKSVNVKSYSSGLVNSSNIEFQVVFECGICHPVEGMLIECDVKTLTKAGIHALVKTDEDVTPVTVFIARDHNYNDSYFGTIKENMKIIVRVIGIRYELNDPYICVIGKLVQPRDDQLMMRKGGMLRISLEDYGENLGMVDKLDENGYDANDNE
jgi:DNA-directed RNA polymerase subunit E'/Rpb7